MGVTITLSSDASIEDLKAVRAFVDSYLGQPANKESVPPEPKAAPPAVKKAAPKPEPVKEPEPEPEQDDVLGGEDEAEVDYAALRSQATALATKLVSEGRTPDVKAALKANGDPGRVSKLEDEHLAGFIAALS